MREELGKIGSEERHVFTGRFERTGWKAGYKGPMETVLLLDIRDAEGNPVTDHLWFNLTNGFRDANIEPGDEVQFSARVQSYVKGYFGRREDVWCPIQNDYKLSYPSKVKKLSA